MNNSTLKPPSGFIEYNPERQSDFDFLKDKIESHYKKLGFIKVDTPAVESLGNLVAKGSCDQEIFTLTRLGSDKKSDMGLRFDLTVPFARYVASHQTDLCFPFKRYQISPVWRGERAQNGRYREFYQCDIDIVAPEKLSQSYDAFIIFSLYSTLEKINLTHITISLNDKKLLDTLADCHGVSKENKLKFFRLIDKKHKLTSDIFHQEMVNLIGIEETDKLFNLFSALSSRSFLESCSYLQSAYDNNENILLSIESLKNIHSHALSLGVNEEVLVLDITIARGLNYYSGLIFETTWNDYPEIGSIASGGRYNNLVEAFSKRTYQGIGFSIGLSRIFSIICLHEIHLRDKDLCGLLVSFDKNQIENDLSFFLLYSKILSYVDNRVDCYLQGKKYQDQLLYAKKNRFRYFLSKRSDKDGVESFEVKDLLDGCVKNFESENDLLEFFDDKRI
jgi:histidyl-tRNA synthetase